MAFVVKTKRDLKVLLISIKQLLLVLVSTYMVQVPRVTIEFYGNMPSTITLSCKSSFVKKIG